MPLECLRRPGANSFPARWEGCSSGHFTCSCVCVSQATDGRRALLADAAWGEAGGERASGQEVRPGSGVRPPWHSPKASMQPRSSSSTVQPLSRSRVHAMVAGARGRGPSGSVLSGGPPAPTPVRREAEAGVRAEARSGETGVSWGCCGRERGGAGTPPAGQGRSCRLRPLPGLNGPAWDAATAGLGNGPLRRFRPTRPRSRGRVKGLHREGGAPGCPARRRPLLSRRHLQQHPAAPLRAPPASLPPQPPLPRTVILGTQSLRGPRRNFSPGWEKGSGEEETQASCPSRCLSGRPKGREAGLERPPGACLWGSGLECRATFLGRVSRERALRASAGVPARPLHGPACSLARPGPQLPPHRHHAAPGNGGRTRSRAPGRGR